MKKDLTLLYAISELAYWMGFASILAFVSMYLLSIDVRNTVIGIVIAAGGVLSALTQPVLGTLSDRFPFFTIRRILVALAVLILISAAAMLLTHGSLPVFACILYGCCIMVLQQIQPFINALGMRCLNTGYRLDFGIARAIGSLGYALAAFYLGRLTDKFGATVIPQFILVAFATLLLTVFFYPRAVASAQLQEERTGQGANSVFAFFKKYRQFTLFLTGLILIYFGHTLINSFTLQIIETKGGGNTEMGTATSIAAILELGMMFLFTRIMKRVPMKTLLRVSGCFFTLKLVGSLLAPGVISYYLVQILQMFGWGIMAVALVYYVNEIMAVEDCVKGQAYATMTYTVGTVLGAWIGGSLIDQSGVNSMLICGILVSLVGTLILFAGTATYRKKDAI